MHVCVCVCKAADGVFLTRLRNSECYASLVALGGTLQFRLYLLIAAPLCISILMVARVAFNHVDDPSGTFCRFLSLVLASSTCWVACISFTNLTRDGFPCLSSPELYLWKSLVGNSISGEYYEFN